MNPFGMLCIRLLLYPVEAPVLFGAEELFRMTLRSVRPFVLSEKCFSMSSSVHFSVSGNILYITIKLQLREIGKFHFFLLK